MLKQRPWDKYEAAILLDALLKVNDGAISRKDAILSVSDKLRRRAIILGLEIDDTFRNEAGILFQMHSMESAYLGYTVVKPASKLFLDIVELWRNNKPEFEKLLNNAMKTPDNKSVEEDFYAWLAKKVSDKMFSQYYIAFFQINEFCSNRGILKDHIFKTTDLGILSSVEKTINEDKSFWKKYKRQIKTMSSAIRFYLLYVEEEILEKSDEIGLEMPKTKKSLEENVIPVIKEDEASNYVDISQRQQDFLDWMIQNNTNPFAAKTYLSALSLASEIALAKGITNKNVYEIQDPYFLIDLLTELRSIPEFEKKNEERFNQLATAWNKYATFSKDSSSIQSTKKPKPVDGKVRVKLTRSVSGKAIAQRITDSEDKITDSSSVTRDTVLAQQNNNDSVYSEEYIKKNYLTVYMHLKSMSTVFDNEDNVGVDWIRTLLGNAVERDELVTILNSLPWITKVDDGVYSFIPSKDANEKTQKSLPKTEAETVIDFDKDAFIKILIQRYPGGMRFDSIDLENYRETYKDIIGDDILLSDTELESCLRKCGIMYQNRLFPAEGIINKAAREKLMEYIRSHFEYGKNVLYYKSIFSDLSDTFVYCYNLTDYKMLRPYLEFTCEPGEFYFTDEYISKEKSVVINHSAEIEEYMLSVRKPLSYDEIYAGLSHIAKEIIHSEIKSNPRYLLNEREHYFHFDIFELSSEEADQITDYIRNEINEEGYCIWSRVYKIIHSQMPLFIENNACLSSLGIRNGLAKKLSGRFSFDGEVISNRNNPLNMSAVFRIYGERHAPFSENDIYMFSKEINGGVTYFNSLSEVTIRVSKDLFIPRTDIAFNVDETDEAISTFFSSEYVFVKEFDSFLAFPTVGYEWNIFLLESYLLCYSKHYTLENNGRSLGNVAGAVVKKNGKIHTFEDVCADALANSECTLSKNKALDYLVDTNLLTRKSYSKIENVLVKAKQIRNKRGNY